MNYSHEMSNYIFSEKILTICFKNVCCNCGITETIVPVYDQSCLQASNIKLAGLEPQLFFRYPLGKKYWKHCRMHTFFCFCPYDLIFNLSSLPVHFAVVFCQQKHLSVYTSYSPCRRNSYGVIRFNHFPEIIRNQIKLIFFRSSTQWSIIWVIEKQSAQSHWHNTRLYFPIVNESVKESRELIVDSFHAGVSL